MNTSEIDEQIARLQAAKAALLDSAEEIDRALTERLERLGIEPKSSARKESLSHAHRAGVTDDLLRRLCSVARLSRADTIVLPPNRLEKLSRGRGWCRKGRGTDAEWGERVEGGYRVGPGRWTVGGHDGFSRKRTDDWRVEHVQVGDQTWTLAE